MHIYVAIVNGVEGAYKLGCVFAENGIGLICASNVFSVKMCTILNLLYDSRFVSHSE